MNPLFAIESRSFREFYPDPEIRHQVHYVFAHRFVPLYVWQSPWAFFMCLYGNAVPGGPVDPTHFIQSRWSAIFEPRLNGTIGPGPSLRQVTDLSMSIQELGGRPSALIQMPPPEEVAEAYFICVVLLGGISEVGRWPHDVAARVFTLERRVAGITGDDNDAFVCEWLTDRHSNYGMVLPPDRGAFLSAVESILKPAADRNPGNG